MSELSGLGRGKLTGVPTRVVAVEILGSGAALDSLD